MNTISSRQLRIGVVGAGLIGRRHVALVEASDRATVAFVADPSAEAVVVAGSLGIPHYPDVTEALKATRSDAVIIATPNHLHVENGLECVRAGLPMLIEKPIADRSEPAGRLVDAADAANTPVLIGHHRRHNPLIAEAKRSIDAQSLGRIVAVHANFWLYKPADYFDAEWRTKDGAGPVFINLIHDIDLLRHLVGEVQSVVAMESRQTRRFDVEDTAALILRFVNGAIGTVTVSDTIVAPWSWELTAAENAAYPATGQTCYQIGGTKGSLEVPTGRIWSQSGERSWWRPIGSKVNSTEAADPLEVQLDHLCDVIEGKAAPLVSGKEGLRSLQVIEAIKKSAVTGAVVDVSSG